MNLFDLAMRHVPLRKVGREWHGPCPACGTGQKDPRLSDRFTVKDDDRWFCRTCRPEGGDAVAFLMTFEGMKCGETHAALGKLCMSTTCAALGKCKLGRDGQVPARERRLDAPKQDQSKGFAPVEASAPASIWGKKAAALVEHAHQALLVCDEQLVYLERRGLDREAVVRYRLGWLDEDLYRARSAWGLDEQLREDGKPKKLWLPCGIVIPFFGVDGEPERIRIRRPQIKEGEPRYYWVPGSGDNVPVIGTDRQAFVVVESDLDALLVHHLAGDVVGAIPLGTCSAKPKAGTMAALQQALTILVALDCEPRVNATTGRHENPGGKAAAWWLEVFDQAKRWPTPDGKDPGEFFEAGGDVRSWVMAGLPAVFRLQKKAIPCETTTPVDEPAQSVVLLRGVSRQGVDYAVVKKQSDFAAGEIEAPGCVLFTVAEIDVCRGMSEEEANAVMMTKKTIPGSLVNRREAIR